MTAQSAALAGRRLAESLMIDSCTIRRAGADATDPVTGVVTPSSTTVYSGKCKVQTLDPQEATPVAGGYSFTVQRYRVDIPVGAYAPAIGDVATIDTSVLDEFLVAREFRVVALLHKTAATAYRLAVTDEAA